MKENLLYDIYLILKSFFFYTFQVRIEGKGSKRILVINHYFDQDISSIVRSSDCLKYIIVKPEIFQPIRNIYPEIVHRGNIEYDHPSLEDKRKWARHFSFFLFKWMKWIYKFELIITPSDIFFWLREFIIISKQNKISTIVIDKEGVISPYYFEHHSAKIKNNFPLISDRIIVWSNRQKNFWIKCGAEESRIKIIGQPRSDLLLKKNDTHQNENYILFLTYFENAYVPKEIEEKGISWSQLRAETHEILKEIALLFADQKIIIKCHPQQRDIKEIKKEFLNYRNIHVETGTQKTDMLLINAGLVVGFQSTALIESILLKKNTIYTFWTKSVEDFKDGILPFHKFKSFLIAHSKQELLSLLSMYCNKTLSSNRFFDEELIHYYLNLPDGSVGLRINKYLKDYLQNHGGK